MISLLVCLAMRCGLGQSALRGRTNQILCGFATWRLGVKQIPPGLSRQSAAKAEAEMVLVSGSTNMPRLTAFWTGASRRCQIQFGLDE